MYEYLSSYLKLADAVIITDEDHRIIDINAKYEEVTGYRRDMIIGLQAGILKSGLTPKKTYVEMKRALKQRKPWSGVFVNRKRNREIWYSSITISPLTFGKELFFVGVFRDLEQLPEGLYVSEERKSKLQHEVLKVLALSCEIRDPDIEAHLTRVQQMTRTFLMAYNEIKERKLSDSYIQQIVNASILHDIGKSGIPEGILYKPGKLAHYERAIMETHPLIGADIWDKISHGMDDKLFQQELIISKSIIAYHHEKWDGTGYPYRLKGEEIPFEAHVVSIVDVYDALTSRRAYKDAWTKEQALQYMIDEKGASFQPALVDIFVQAMTSGWFSHSE